ncbi:MAG: hypothetical protein JST26_10690 [Bacteroidetes bacterium]|nr:hypothetical protein [Bacteroidota bacterium]
MKKLILSLAALSIISISQAQTTTTPVQGGPEKTQKTPPSPDKVAQHDAIRIARELSLNDDQKAKVQAFALERATTNNALREKEKSLTQDADKKALRKEMKANKDKFFNNVNGILTPEQQTKWAQMRQEQMDKHKAMKAQKMKDPAVSTPAGN